MKLILNPFPTGPALLATRPKSVLGSLFATVALVACGGGGGGGGFNFPITGGSPPPSNPDPVKLTCDDSIKSGFKPDQDTSVLLVKSFKKGDALLLTGSATPATPVAQNDLCLVKLLVGPGNPGPVDAPSTSPGIGIEVWLPAPSNWNNRLHVVGNGGWAGDAESSTTSLSAGGLSFSFQTPADIAGIEGAVSASTDTGHQSNASLKMLDGSFAMNPDGTINEALWRDFASRGIHEMAVKSKALAKAYYGSEPRYSYWDGNSTGGRQGLAAAQFNPGDFDGILASAPAINWTKFITAELYPQIVFQQDLGGTPMSEEQQNLVSNAAIAACDSVAGVHLGYILEPSKCTYDPTTDLNVLCPASGGTNTSAACVSTAQANAMNKIWYGMTIDGSVPPPASDLGWGPTPSGRQLWYGVPRGTATGAGALADPAAPFAMAPSVVALELQNPTIAERSFRNATGNGADGWRTLSYTQLANAFDRGIALQDSFGRINTDNPDLSAFMNAGGKMITLHGLNDTVIFPQGTINYYERVAAQMGGLSNVQSFYRLYLVPGKGHGPFHGMANPAANPPLPEPGQIYDLLTAWVENGVAPDRIELSNADKTIAQPVCPYPQKATYQSGNPLVSASYTCS